MMHGKFLRKMLPLMVSASMLMGTAASVMAEGTENDIASDEVTTELENESPVDEETGDEEPTCQDTIPEENARTIDPVSDGPLSEEMENDNNEEPTEPEEPQKFKVRLKDGYAHVSVQVSDKKYGLPVAEEENTDPSVVSEALSDENLILVTVENDNPDRLISGEELEEMMQVSVEDDQDTLITANAGQTEMVFTEGTTIYISALAEEEYRVSNIFLTGDNGETIGIESEEEDGIWSFIMPGYDVNLDVLTEEDLLLNPADLSETEIQALEEYIEKQGLSVSRNAVMLAASNSSVKTITFNMNGFISYSAEGYGSGYDAMFYIHTANYRGNGNGYCLNPAVQAPGSSQQGQQISYTTTVYDYTDPMLLKIMYYGFGGPGDITGSHASTPTARHILTHMVCVKRAKELGISGAGDYTYRANSTAIAKADALYNAIKAKADINGTVSILTPVAGQQTIMLLSNYSIPETKGKLKLTKTSAKVELSDGNPNYSLKGAGYIVCSDREMKNLVGTFTTNSDGTSSVELSLNPGTYYVKEVTVPKGYQLDETVYTATVTAGKTSTVKVSDIPANDPISLLLEKVDAKTGETSERLKGAKFEVKFYPVENEADMNEPKWSWIFETDSNGRIRLDDAHKVSGDDLPKSTTGATLIPLGFLTIQETEAPFGYLINDTMYVCHVMQDRDTVRTTNLPTGENAVKEQPSLTEISVSKTVTGNAGNKNEEFSFKLSLTNNNDPSIVINNSYWVFYEEEGKETVVKSITSKNGAYSFTLHHGQTATIKDLPIGAAYTAGEMDGESRGYTVTNKKVSGVLTAEPVQINVINDKEMTIPTGSDTNRNILLLMTAASLVLISLFIGVKALKRNK